MLSDLANSVKGIDLRAQDDTFLVAHLVAGIAEVDEIYQLITKLKARHEEARAIQLAVEETLRARHQEGKTFAFGSQIVTVPPASCPLKLVTVSQAEILALPELKEGMVQVSQVKKVPDPAAPRRVK